MQVINFIKEKGFQALTDELGISVREEGNLVVLKYSQIDSPKTHPVVMECRGLILEKETLEVVCRPFDRFFNLGEGGKQWDRDSGAIADLKAIDWSKAEVVEKVDGSIIKFYFYGGKWNIATNGTAFADTPVHGYPLTFRELVYKALKVENEEQFQKLMRSALLYHDMTYIFELTSVENRVVKHYSGYKLHFLGARVTRNGVYMTKLEEEYLFEDHCKLSKLIHKVPRYKFDSDEACLKAARELKDLDEGYIVYVDEVPVAKVKSPTYVAVHHIKGEGLNPKRICELVLGNEVEEYLSYFPDDRHVIEPYINGHNYMMDCLESVYRQVKDLESQKDFAIAISPFKFKGALFDARKNNISAKDAFVRQRDTFKIEVLKDYVSRVSEVDFA